MKPRVLIVEDDPSFAELLSEVVRGMDLEPELAMGFEALEQAATCEPPPALILLDLVLGNIDGIQVLRLLSRICCRAPLLLTSGSDERICSSAHRLGRELGLNMLGVMRKPFELDQLEPLIAAAARGRDEELALDWLMDASHYTPHYQPKVELASGRVCGFEQLARWNGPDGRIVPALPAVQRIEREGQAERLFAFSLERACADALDLLVGLPEARLYVNVSPSLLADSALPERALQIVERAGVDPARVAFEVTEATAMRNPVHALEVLSRLRLMRFDLAIDDFGVEYSCLAWLHQLPFTELKIDRSFVTELPGDANAMAVVGALIDLAHALGMSTCAEGIETTDARDWLLERGSDQGQGYLMARPMPPEEAAAWTCRWLGSGPA